MYELKVQNAYDREKVVSGLANSGYIVTVVNRKIPNKLIGEEHFIQIYNKEEFYREHSLQAING